MLDFLMGEVSAVVFTCRVCHVVVPIQRLNGSPKEITCPNCHATYRAQLEMIRPPIEPYQKLRPGRTEVIKA